MASVRAAMPPQAPPVTAMDTRNLDYVVRSGVAGGVAGCAAKTSIAPSDRVKISFQTGEPQFARWAGTSLGSPRAATYIVRSEGFPGLFRGHSATLARIFPYAAIKFVAYEQIRSTIIPTRLHETHFRRFMAGSSAGSASVIFTYPSDVVRVQLAYKGSQPEVKNARHRLYQTVQEMWHRPAANPLARIANFYPGFVPTLSGIIPYAGMSFFAHDLGHDIFRSKWSQKIAVNRRKEHLVPEGKQAPLHGWAELLAGGMSGIVAQTSAYPFEVIRRRMQVSGISGHRQTIRSVAAKVYRDSGLRGFFIGSSIGYIKVGPMAACSFYVYEKMKYLSEI